MDKLKRLEMSPEQLDALIARMESSGIDEDDLVAVKAMAESIKLLRSAVQEKTMSVKRVLQMLFGPSTEKSTNILSASGAGPSGQSGKQKPRPKTKPKGHGRNGAASYTGANRVQVAHESLKPGDECPECSKGKVYPFKPPALLLCLVGTSPVQATVLELERLRCNLCGMLFTAKTPEAYGKSKYDETVGSIIALLKYGGGFPFNRIEKLQGGFGIPLAASTQWEIVERKAKAIRPVYEQLIRQAAQGSVVYNDDTKARILEFMSVKDGGEEDDSARSGLFTTGILSQTGEHQIALYYTGKRHAGENLAEVLSQRDADRGPPIQMCDALARNLPNPFKVILANCLVHARRNFVDLTEYFPEQTRFIFDKLAQVYKHDAIAKERGMSDDERLSYHQAESAPIMDELKSWLFEQSGNKTIEPNSSMGKAILYMLNHWPQLTLFLQVSGAPLDNNLCEQILKRSILHRKNSLFFKTQHGADVGDLYMSLIHTCILNGANPFEYMTEIEKHSAELPACPERWMPWNYKQNLSES